MTGTIVRIVSQRGFGFIQEQDGKEVFFHASGVAGSTPFDYLQEGQQVVLREAAGRPRAGRARRERPAGVSWGTAGVGRPALRSTQRPGARSPPAS